ncbi:MAG: DUF937 domain-containing protein [Candidatus Eisenbacteria bacterium]|uniref:DUF937 domain-containing protein n=1 Tax=Eiseniibacteriota bacterium TaxID=2212470 RepID=A0A956ND14_UNCEI|nr:DUF937 domain-containing protein [Candidatus Eisenbacteria bacterium]MCB9465768.1 DUF937 domain-containing protein [Candidatus Eisenbacteria bacterium]
MSMIMDLLQQQLGGDAVKEMSRQVGADERATQNVLGAALPMLMGALARNAQSGGAQSLLGALQRDHDGSVLDDVMGYLGKSDGADGSAILGHVLGAKQGRVEQGLAKTSGLDMGQVSKLLAMAAPLVLGALGKQQQQRGMDADGLSALLGGERQTLEQKAPAEMGLLGSLLDSDGDGDVDMQDIAKKGLGMLGGLFGNK